MEQLQRWQNIKNVFNLAVDHASAGRTSFVEQLCANDPLLGREVLSLIRAHEVSNGCLDSPVVLSAVSWDGPASELEKSAASPPIINLTGRIISHYRIEEQIGKGGMGVVYRARDLALGRDVAFKTLPNDFSVALRRKLLREADTSSRLQHPGIATFYEAAEAEGTAFIAMELVRGETLRQRLQHGPLPIRQAVAVASCLLEALSHAHAAGIVHGDIKPENIMLTGPRTAKLLDFGLAKHLMASDHLAPQAPASGRMIAGTVGYMSPEQVRNEPLDIRSDLFQAGVLLYEILSGTPAFPGESAAARLAAVLNDEPPLIQRETMPKELRAALRRALRKAVAERFGSAGEFLTALQDACGGEALDELPDSIAVLDFVSAAGPSEDDWIGRGLTDTLQMDLRRSYGIEVLRRELLLEFGSSAAAPMSPAATALALGCRWSLSGSFIRSGNEVEVEAILTEASTGRVAFQGAFQGTLDELFRIESEIAGRIGNSLRPATLTQEAAHPRPSLSAFECYARAQQLFERRDRGSIGQAGELLMKAVKLDPAYAPALAALAGVFAIRFTYTSDASSLEKAMDFARRAIKEDPNSAQAHTWMGYCLARQGSVPQAREAWRRAREADPAGYYAYYFDVPVAAHVGANAEALQLARRAVELSAKPASPLWGLGCLHLVQGRYPEARWCFQRCIEILKRGCGTEGSPGVEGCLGECLRRMGELHSARQFCMDGIENAEKTDYVYRDTNRVLALVALGRTALDDADVPCAEAAFAQAIAHIHGRNRTLGGGQLLVQALAGAARAAHDPQRFEEAVDLFSSRDGYDFSWYWLCTDDVTCADLAAAARALNRSDEALAFLERARKAGRGEAPEGGD